MNTYVVITAGGFFVIGNANSATHAINIAQNVRDVNPYDVKAVIINEVPFAIIDSVYDAISKAAAEWGANPGPGCLL